MTSKHWTRDDTLATDMIRTLINEHNMPGWLWKDEAREAIKKAFRAYACEKAQ